MGTSKLWEALDLVRRKRMVKGIRDDGYGAHCALGFLEKAWGYDMYLHPALFTGDSDLVADLHVLSDVMCELFPDRFSVRSLYATTDIVDINNHSDTTRKDLEVAFEKAAIRRDELLGQQ